jgi:DnaJ-class molecular chaperone
MSKQQHTPTPCTACGGTGGIVIDTSSEGVLRQNWHTCGACGGTGTQGGRS